MRVIIGKYISSLEELGLHISNQLLDSWASSLVGTGTIFSLLASLASYSVGIAYTFSMLQLFASAIDNESTFVPLFDLLDSYSEVSGSTLSLIEFLVVSVYSACTSTSTLSLIYSLGSSPVQSVSTVFSLTSFL